MAECSICGKKRAVGNNVSHANNRTKRTIMPNIQKVKIITDSGNKRSYVCTRCIRSRKIVKAT